MHQHRQADLLVRQGQQPVTLAFQSEHITQAHLHEHEAHNVGGHSLIDCLKSPQPNLLPLLVLGGQHMLDCMHFRCNGQHAHQPQHFPRLIGSPDLMTVNYVCILAGALASSDVTPAQGNARVAEQ